MSNTALVKEFWHSYRKTGQEDWTALEWGEGGVDTVVSYKQLKYFGFIINSVYDSDSDNIAPLKPPWRPNTGQGIRFKVSSGKFEPGVAIFFMQMEPYVRVSICIESIISRFHYCFD